MKKGIMHEELIMPQKIILSERIINERELLSEKPPIVSFSEKHTASFSGRGAKILLDFGKEIAGGIRIITRTPKGTKLHIRFGESAAEACAPLCRKNAGNDHSPRDTEASVSVMSDLTFGQTAFRFVLIETSEDVTVTVQNIWAVNRFPVFENEGFIRTSDGELNKILDTAAYTLRLCCQNGCIWDGVKRDRLIWSGDMHQEIITSMYLFGNIENITNSIEFLENDTDPGAWVNTIPNYSAWWIINLCEYCRISGNREFFNRHKKYAKLLLHKINGCILNGKIDYKCENMPFFLDWPTFGTDDAVTGTAALLIFAAKSYLRLEENANGREICRKLEKYTDISCKTKQVRAFQLLAGGNTDGAVSFLEKNGASGLSTFMSYYILSADALSGGKDMLRIIKSYFGGMLSAGATTFWEDFDPEWLNGSGGIDCLPAAGKKDLHGDCGRFCYKGFRHSLCHGWSAGVYAFVIEYILGIKMEDGIITAADPHPMGIERLEAEIPTADGMFCITVRDGKAEYRLRKQ